MTALPTKFSRDVALRDNLKYLVFRTSIRLLRLARPRREINESNRLVYFKPDHIGDFILATEAIHLIEEWAQSKGYAKSFIVTSHQNAALARAEFPELGVASIPYAFDGFGGTFWNCLATAHRAFRPLLGAQVVCLRHQRTLVQDLLLDWLRPSRSYGLTGCALGPRPGFSDIRKFAPTVGASFPLNGPPFPQELNAHATLVNLVTGIPANIPDILPRLRSLPTSEGGGIVVFPKAHGSIREYPPAFLAKLISDARSVCGDRIVLVGQERDHRDLAILAALIRDGKEIPVEIQTPPSMFDAARLIASARVVIGMESGPAHVATALDKRAVLFLGGGHFGIFAPWNRSARQRWLQKSLPCYGCSWNCVREEPECITTISSAAALAALREVLLCA